jgi:hypothetical protein
LLLVAVSCAKKLPAGFCGKESQQYTGYIPLKDVEDRNIFYWLAEHDTGSAGTREPLIVWLGDSCSVLPSLLQTHGPCQLSTNGTLRANPFSWTRFANVLWIDQIAGVGFSRGGARNSWTSAVIASDVIGFLDGFLLAHSKYQKRSLFIFGKGLAGQMTPSISHAVAAHYQGTSGFRLKGFALESSTADPLVTFSQRTSFAMHNSYRIQLLNRGEIRRMTKGVPVCAHLLKRCRTFKGDIAGYEKCTDARRRCSEIYIDPIQSATGGSGELTEGRDAADIRELPASVRRRWCKGAKKTIRGTGHNPQQESLPPVASSTTAAAAAGSCNQFGDAETLFLQRADIQVILGVHRPMARAQPFNHCSKQVNSALFDVWAQPSTEFVRLLLEDGVRLLVYNGDADYTNACECIRRM